MRSAAANTVLLTVFSIFTSTCYHSLPIDIFGPNAPEGVAVNSNDDAAAPFLNPQVEEQPPSAPEDLAELFKAQKSLGHVSGLAVNANGHLVTFDRGNRVWDEKSFNEDETFDRSLLPITNKTLSIFDQSGKLIDEFGDNTFYMPHGLTIDHHGDYWVTDVGSHQIHHIDAKTKKIVKSLGEKMVPGSDAKHFCKPTDVAVARNGDIFVADGYCNSRVLKFDRNGKLLASISAAMEEDQPTDFIVPHSLSLIEDMNTICVADRENERVQCFSAGLPEGERNVPTGIPITSANDIGRVFAIRERNHMLIGVTGSSEDLESQLFAIDMETGKTQAFAKGIDNAHAIAISPNGDVFVSQMEPNRIVRFTPII